MATIVFRPEDWVNSQPNSFDEYTGGTVYKSWNTQTIPIQLPNTDHKIVKLTLSGSNFATNRRDNFFVGYFSVISPEIKGKVTVQDLQPGSTPNAISSQELLNLYTPVTDFKSEIGEVDISHFLFTGAPYIEGPQEFLLNVNGDRDNLSSELTLQLHLGYYEEGGISADQEVSASIDCNYQTVTTYNAGMHPYSAYNAISESSTFTTKVYTVDSLSEGAMLYADPYFTKPALPYYYGIGSNVYRVGDLEIDRNYSTVLKYKGYRRFMADTKVETRFEGPTTNWYIEGERRQEPSTRLLWSEFHNDSSYEYTPMNISPFMSSIGSIRKVYTNSSIPEPSVYRYYMTHGALSAAQALNKWRYWNFRTENHTTANGEFNALLNLGNAIAAGLTEPRNWNWKTIAEGNFIKYNLHTPQGGTSPGGYEIAATIIVNVPFLLYYNRVPIGIGKNVSFTSDFVKAIYKFISGGKNVHPPISAFSIILHVLILAILIYYTFKAKWFMETQPALRNVFGTNPRITVGNNLYKDADLTTEVDNEYYSDGFYYYQYSNYVLGKGQEAITGITNLDSSDLTKQIENRTATAPDSSTEITDWQKLITLPYVCGKPVPGKTTGGATSWSNGDTTGNLGGYPVGNFARQQYTSVTIPAGYVTSYISQADADQEASRILSASMKLITGSTRPAIVDDEYLISSSLMYFTHTLKVENYSKQLDVFFTGSLTSGTTLYYDPEGRVKVLNGYYSTGSAGSNFRDYYLVESGSILKTETLATSGSTTSLSGQPVDTTFQDYTSAWGIRGISKYDSRGIYNNITVDRFFDTSKLLASPIAKRVIASGSVNTPEDTLVKVYSGSGITATGSFDLPTNNWYSDTTRWTVSSELDVFTGGTFSLPEKIIRPTFVEDCTWQSGSATERGVYVRFLTGSGGSGITNPVYDVDLSFEVNTSTGTAGTYRVTVPGNKNQVFVPLIDSNFTPGDYFTSITLGQIFSPNPNRGVTIETGSILSKRCQAPANGSETIFISAIRDNCDDLCWQSGDTSYLVNNSSNSTETYANITLGTYITDVAGNVPNYVGYVAVAASSTQTSDTSNVKILEVDNFGFVASIINCSGGTCTNPL